MDGDEERRLKKEKNALRKAQRLAKVGILSSSAQTEQEIEVKNVLAENGEKQKRGDAEQQTISSSKKQKVCRLFLKGGSCSFDGCKFLHCTAEQVGGQATATMSTTQDEPVVCQMYSRTRSCKYGDTCMYQHIASDKPQSMDSSTRRLRNPIPRIQEKQKKRKAKESQTKHEARTLKRGRGDEPVREKKIKKAPNLHLDEEAYKQKTRVKSKDIESFHCFRCNIDKSSRNRYDWKTSDGTKTICNGCYGNLIAKTKVDG